MASYTPTTTCNDMASRIADELSRSDLTSQIQLEINSSILWYASKQMWGSEASWNFPTVAGQRLYSVAVNFRSISSVMASYNSGNYQFLVEPRTFEFIQSIDFGLSNFSAYPQYYAYQGNQIRFYPPTFTAGTIYVYGQVDQLPLVFNQTTAWAANTGVTSGVDIIFDSTGGTIQTCSTSGTTGSTAPTWSSTLNATTTDGTAVWTCTGCAMNFWTTEAEELIRSRTLSNVSARYINDNDAAIMYAEMERQAFVKMKGDNIARGMSSGKVVPTQF